VRVWANERESGAGEVRPNSSAAKICAAAIIALAILGVALPASGQGIKRIMVARARVLEDFGPGIAEMKGDGHGRYYILAKPANVIWIVGVHGQKLGQIPSANTPAANAIQYAVDFDIDPNGRILVADRGANAVKIYQPDGSFSKKVEVYAPTSVVALVDGEFAVSTLRPKRLILVVNDDGELLRSFGDPADVGLDASKAPLMSLGKISGDSTNHVYFAFTTLNNPMIRIFDRYGYAHGDATVTADQLSYTPPGKEDRVQFGVNVSRMDFSSMFDGGAMIGSSGDIQFNGGVGSGLGGRLGGGSGPATGAGVIQTLLSSGVGGVPGSGTGGRGGRAGGMITGQAVIDGSDIHVNLLTNSRGANGKGTGSDASDSDDDSDTSSTYKFRFLAKDSFNSKNSDDDQWLDQALADFDSAQALDQANGYGLGPNGAGADGTNGLGQGILVGAGGFGGGTFPGGFGAHGIGHGAGAVGAAGVGTPGAGGPHPGGYGGGFGGFGAHGRFPELTNVTATVRINLDPTLLIADEKPVITAVGVDPQTQEIWAGIGKALMHFDKNGNLLDSYLMATPDGAPLRASAIVVEPDRLLIGSDPRGVYEFERPDKQAAQ
jgi:hypothetical protein